MPPQVTHYSPQLTPPIRSIPPTASSFEAEPRTAKHTRGNRKMKFNVRKLIPALVLILVCVSILRLLGIALNTSFSPSTLLQACSTSPFACAVFPADVTQNSTSPVSAASLSAKELHFLSDMVEQKAPCNLLIFGLEPQYLILSSINAGGTTIILEDDSTKLAPLSTGSSSAQIHMVEYRIPGNKAYKLLEHARKSPACGPSLKPLQSNTCRLALTGLPHEVYQTKWDIIVVDGPSGHAPEVPGRMSTIYTAGVMARAGNSTDVLVHDINRTIEKWFSWEFLCEENLISSKGKFWNFRIQGQSNLTRLCNPRTVVIH